MNTADVDGPQPVRSRVRVRTTARCLGKPPFADATGAEYWRQNFHCLQHGDVTYMNNIIKFEPIHASNFTNRDRKAGSAPRYFAAHSEGEGNYTITAGPFATKDEAVEFIAEFDDTLALFLVMEVLA
jgi:hypothetical protein